MAYPESPLVPKSDGDTLTGAEYTNEITNCLNKLTPSSINDASANLAAMQTTVDPGESGTESLATTLEGEIQRTRFAIKDAKGTTYWYETPVATLASLKTSVDAKLPLAGGTMTGNIVFNPTTAGITGTTTNDDAADGTVGRYVTSFQAATNAPATTAWGDLTSISLTAGDWDVTVEALSARNGATQSRAAVGASTTTGNSATGLTLGDTSTQWTAQSTASMPEFGPLVVSNIRFSLAATTTVYLKYSADYTAGTPTCRGRISARRVR
jgi:hypothetical protein